MNFVKLRYNNAFIYNDVSFEIFRQDNIKYKCAACNGLNSTETVCVIYPSSRIIDLGFNNSFFCDICANQIKDNPESFIFSFKLGLLTSNLPNP